MQTRSSHFSTTLKMKRTAELAILSLLSLLLIFPLCSCAREDLKVFPAVSQPYVSTDGHNSLSLWFDTSDGYKDAVALEIRSPQGEYTWHLEPLTAQYKGATYTGSADASMPAGLPLPKGQWTYTLVFKDGRTYEGSFEIKD